MQINKISNINFKGTVVSKPDRALLTKSLRKNNHCTEKQAVRIAENLDEFCKRLEKETPDGVLCSVSVKPQEYALDKEHIRGVRIYVNATNEKYPSVEICASSGLTVSKDDESGARTFKSLSEIDEGVDKCFNFNLKEISEPQFIEAKNRMSGRSSGRCFINY